MYDDDEDDGDEDDWWMVMKMMMEYIYGRLGVENVGYGRLEVKN